MIDVQYLGDSVYAKYDGDCIELTTNDGTGSTNTIYLEPAVYDALVKFADRVKSRKSKFSEERPIEESCEKVKVKSNVCNFPSITRGDSTVK
jgi:hypothetical protein